MAKKVLIVTDNDDFVEEFRRELIALSEHMDISAACSTEETLAELLGSTSGESPDNGSRIAKLKPHVVIIDSDSDCVDVFDLMGFFRRYYTLQGIRLYLAGQYPEKKISAYIDEKVFVSGFITRPFSFAKDDKEIRKLKDDLVRGSKALSFLPAFLWPDDWKLSSLLKFFGAHKLGVSVVASATAVVTTYEVAKMQTAAPESSLKRHAAEQLAVVPAQRQDVVVAADSDFIYPEAPVETTTGSEIQPTEKPVVKTRKAAVEKKKPAPAATVAPVVRQLKICAVPDSASAY